MGNDKHEGAEASVLLTEPLFPEEIQAWRYGPVCPPAYRFYSEFEAEQLPIPEKSAIAEIPEEESKLLDEVSRATFRRLS